MKLYVIRTLGEQDLPVYGNDHQSEYGRVSALAGDIFI